MEQQIASVSDVNQLVKGLMEGNPILQHIYVRGELSNYKIYPSGHYFTMKDAQCSLRCVLFKGNASRLNFRPENGMRVIAEGRVNVYVRDGVYQLLCWNLTPDGAGALALAYEQLKNRLNAEGLFDPAHKKPIPPYPENVVVITSSAGEAVHDIIRTMHGRYPLAAIRLLPVRVQGVEAPGEIAEAIRYANKWHLGDLIITGRGGGSMEDLWAFNDERVARAIYASQIPVISAVGHEPDVTISDFVADARASTPTKAADVATAHSQAELQRWIQDAQVRMRRAEMDRISGLRRRLQIQTTRRCLTDQTAYLQDRRMDLAHIQRRLSDVSTNILGRKRQRFGALAAALDAMSPLKVFQRGYSMVQDDQGRILRSSAGLKTGDHVSVQLGEGGFSAVIDTVQAVQTAQIQTGSTDGDAEQNRPED